MRGHNKYAGANQPGRILPNGVGQQMVQLELKAHGGPHAQPITQSLPAGGGIEIHTWGGFTKFEAAAVQIAAGIVANPSTQGADPKEVGATAAALAERVLIACGELLKTRTEEAQAKEAQNEHA